MYYMYMCVCVSSTCETFSISVNYKQLYSWKFCKIYLVILYSRRKYAQILKLFWLIRKFLTLKNYAIILNNCTYMYVSSSLSSSLLLISCRVLLDTLTLGLRFPLIVCTSVPVHKIHPLTGIRRYFSSMNPYKFKQVGLV